MKNKTMKQRLFDLHVKGCCEDVYPVKKAGNKLLCRFSNGYGGYLKLVSAETITKWEETCDIELNQK